MLAKRTDLKHDLGIVGSDLDEALSRCLSIASSIAERVAGLADGALRRQVDVVEFPRDTRIHTRTIYLGVRPIESVTEIKQLYVTSADSAFANADALVADDDYVLIDGLRGAVRRIGALWYADVRCVRVTFTAGYADPNGDIPDGASAPPSDLQAGVRRQAVAIWNNRSNAGLRDRAAGEMKLAVLDIEPVAEIVAAAARYRSSL